MIDVKERHLPEIFFANVREFANRPFLGWKTGGAWKTISWKEMDEKVRFFALGLMSLGVKANDHVAIFSPNRWEWGVSDLAILSCGAADIPIYPTNSSVEAEYILNDSGSSMVIVAEREHLKRVLDVRHKVPTLTHIITMDAIPGIEDEQVLHFDQVIELGRRHPEPKALDRRLNGIDRDQMATLIYTSGTTGPPKGVILSHFNFLVNIQQAYLSHEDMFEKGQCGLSFLPMSHVLERTASWYMVSYLGGSLYFAESPLTVVDNMKEIHPHFVVSVPRLFEKIHGGIMEKLASASPRKQQLFNWALDVGKRRMNDRIHKRHSSAALRVQHALAERLVFKKIRENLGADAIRLLISGGGPLAGEINEFFNALGMTIHEAYGLTETSPAVTANDFDHFRFGTVGKPLGDTQVKIAADGEILIKGPQVMQGYYNKPDATKETFTEDGWFKTGDIGELVDGFLKITDRKKDLIITAGGKNISPQNIENALMSDRFIENIVVIGDRRPFISALIVPDFDALKSWAAEKGLPDGTPATLVAQPEVLALYKERISHHNQQFARVEQIKVFRLIDHSFSQENGELTPTMKMKRKAIGKNYQDLIENMYVK